MAKSREKNSLPRTPIALPPGFEDFSTGSKIQDTLLRFLIEVTPGWLERRDLQKRLVDAGAVASTTSDEVARTHIQKALNALDKKLAELNDDQATSWSLQRRRGKGLRLAERRDRDIVGSSLDDRIKALEKQVAYLTSIVNYVAPPMQPLSTSRPRRGLGTDEELAAKLKQQALDRGAKR